jgi:hypothetical protein
MLDKLQLSVFLRQTAYIQDVGLAENGKLKMPSLLGCA